MFLTVTLNPALDKTLRIERNVPIDTLRASEVLTLAGGKGVNVARALLRLGCARGDVRALMPLAGHAGRWLEALAREEGIEPVVVWVAGETRLAITVHHDASRDYWHYLEPGPRVTAAERDAVLSAFEAALDGVEYAIISGSLPSPEVAPLIREMVRLARARGARAVLDTHGAGLVPGLQAAPWLVKPNLEELAGALGRPLDTPAEQWRALEQLAGWGVAVGVLSLGAAGARVLWEGRRYRVTPAPVTEVNALGCGDSMVAGLAWAAAQGCGPEDALRWGAACGAANAAVWDPGGFARADAEALRQQVGIHLLGDDADA